MTTANTSAQPTKPSRRDSLLGKTLDLSAPATQFPGNQYITVDGSWLNPALSTTRLSSECKLTPNNSTYSIEYFYYGVMGLLPDGKTPDRSKTYLEILCPVDSDIPNLGQGAAISAYITGALPSGLTVGASVGVLLIGYVDIATTSYMFRFVQPTTVKAGS